MSQVTIHHFAQSLRAAAVTLGLLATALLLRPASATEYSEDAVKAAYLYRFTGYIDWPEQGASTPFIIDVLGAPGIARELRRLLPGHPIHGQVAQIREIGDVRDVGTAQVLYLAAGHADVVRFLRPGASGASLLVVSDEEGGLGMGSTLNFLTIDHNVRFEVSLTTAQRWGLRISSELLGVAVRVQGRAGQSFLGCDPPNRLEAVQGPCVAPVARQASRATSAARVPLG